MNCSIVFLAGQSFRGQSTPHCSGQRLVGEIYRDGLFAAGIVLGSLIGAHQIPRGDAKDAAGRLKIFTV